MAEVLGAATAVWTSRKKKIYVRFERRFWGGSVPPRKQTCKPWERGRMEGPDAAYSAINLGANAGGKLYFKPSTEREPLRSSGCGTVYFSSLLRGDTRKRPCSLAQHNILNHR